MAQITTYASLKGEIATWLDRTDLTTPIATFVQLAEAELKKDARVRRLENHGNFSVDAETETLPTDFLALDSLSHNSTTHQGPVQIIGADQLGTIKANYGTSGIPRYAAVVEGSLIFAPVPDGTYTLKLTYWQSFAALSDSATTNWLLLAHPDIYLFGALVQAAPFLKDDPRMAVWEQRLEKSLEALRLYNWNQQYGGGTMRRQFRAIG